MMPVKLTEEQKRNPTGLNKLVAAFQNNQRALPAITSSITNLRGYRPGNRALNFTQTNNNNQTNSSNVQSQTGRKLAFNDNGHPMTNNAWLKTSSGDTYMIGPDSKMRKFNADGTEDTNFQERKLSSLEKNLGTYNRAMQQTNRNTSPYEITNSSWTPEQTARFMKTPVHGGAQRVVAPQTSFLASFQAKQMTNNQTAVEEPKMPRFTAPGFTGKARLARIHSQQQEWLKAQRDQKYGLAKIGMQTNALERNNIRNNETRQEQNSLQSLINQNKATQNNAKKQKNTLQGKWKHITYTDPITQETTAKLYNEITGELKDITSSPSSNDSIGDFIRSLKSEGK